MVGVEELKKIFPFSKCLGRNLDNAISLPGRHWTSFTLLRLLVFNMALRLVVPHYRLRSDV